MRRKARASGRHEAAGAAVIAGARAAPRTGVAARGDGSAGGDGRVLLLWARDKDGAKVRADRLFPADRRRRAPFRCLGCGEPLVPHLGKVRARHFAHLPGSACPLTAPESALHLDAKERLLALCRDAFAGARRVTLLARCPSCRRSAPRELAAVGDAAVEEGAVGTLRADVLVRAAGRPALAFEVKVTHAVDAEKEAALLSAGVPALEIDAREEWERAEGEGVSIAPSRSLGFPPCPACLALSRADADRAQGGEAAEIAELEVYRARGLFGPVGVAEGDLAGVARAFRCPDCGTDAVARGERILKHACESGTRPVAWRGYDGAIVSLAWWRRA